MESGSRNWQQVVRDLQGSIFFEKTLNAVQNLVSTTSELGIPRWFIESHSDKFREVVYLKVAGSTSGIWSVRLYIEPNSTETATTLPDIKLRDGWNEFATFHGLAENDRLLFSLKAMSKFEVYIFHRTGEPKDFCFLSPKREYEAQSSTEEQKLSQAQRLGYEESRQRKQAIREDYFPSAMQPFRVDSQRLFDPTRMSPPSFLKRLTFWSFDNPRGSRLVQTKAVLEIPVVFFRVYGNRLRARVQLQGVGERSPVRNVICVSKAEKGRVRLFLTAGWGDRITCSGYAVDTNLAYSLSILLRGHSAYLPVLRRRTHIASVFCRSSYLAYQSHLHHV